MKKEKLAIVAGGGGMVCDYSAGALCALGEKLKINPDIVVGSSGSTGSLAYFVSRGFESFRNVWTHLLVSKKFINFKRGHHILDIDYMIDGIFAKEDPLDISKVKRSKTKFFISMTNYKTGKGEYKDSSGDVLNEIRASCSVPVVYGKRVKIGGKEYIDGSISCGIKDNIRKAIKEGASKIIVIDANQKTSKFAILLFKIYSYFVNKNLRRMINEYCKKSRDDFKVNNRKIQIFYIRHKGKLPIWALDNTKRDLETTFNIGYNDVLGDKGLRKFLKLG
jgi:predicted patatin/cPLA2 family phospholipase